MRGLKKARRLQILAVSGLALIGVMVILWFLPDDAFQFFRSPSEALAAPPAATEVFRLGGLVEEGSLLRGEGTEISFRVTDGGATIPVVYEGVLPDLFAEGQGVIGAGRLVDGTFQATEILAKHDENYVPREVIDALKEQGVYQEP